MLETHCSASVQYFKFQFVAHNLINVAMILISYFLFFISYSILVIEYWTLDIF